MSRGYVIFNKKALTAWLLLPNSNRLFQKEICWRWFFPTNPYGAGGWGNQRNPGAQGERKFRIAFVGWRGNAAL
jgi:hypothetical protein